MSLVLDVLIVDNPPPLLFTNVIYLDALDNRSSEILTAALAAVVCVVPSEKLMPDVPTLF